MEKYKKDEEFLDCIYNKALKFDVKLMEKDREAAKYILSAANKLCYKI